MKNSSRIRQTTVDIRADLFCPPTITTHHPRCHRPLQHPPTDQLDHRLAATISTLTTSTHNDHPLESPSNLTRLALPAPPATASESLPSLPDQFHPHGTQEEVSVSYSRMTAAGNGLFGTFPLANCPQLFATKEQFICTYATQQHQI
jgi:hypothetical protein